MPVAQDDFPGRRRFVGREAELAALVERLDAARAGHGGIALVGGEAGIGKTRLAEEVATAARARGMTALWGRCYEGEGAPAFWPWIQLLRALTRGTNPAVLRAALGPSAYELAHFLPELRGAEPAPAPAPSPDPAQARFRLFDTVAAFLKDAAARQPVVLLVDDLHWADMPSLLLLEFLAREAGDSRLLVVGTYRDSEAARGHRLHRMLGELVRWPHVTRLLLGGLSDAELSELIVGAAGAPPAAPLLAALVGRSEGNPFFAQELVRLLADPAAGDAPNAGAVGRGAVPPTVREVISRRLDRLSARCLRTLALAAVVGRQFSPHLVGQATGLAGEILLTVLEEAETARIIDPVADAGEAYRFAHMLIRETLYEDLPVARRARLHRRVGEALEALAGPSQELPLMELAHHFAKAAPAGDVVKAVGYARRAGDQALVLLAYEEAAQQYDVALRLAAVSPSTNDTTRCDLLLSLGTALTRAGDLEGGKQAFLRAATLARALGSAERLARAALDYGGWEDIPFPDEVRTHLLQDALQALGADDGSLRAEVLARLARVYYWSGQHDEAIELSATAVALARRAGDLQALLPILSTRHNVLCAPEHLEQRLALAQEMRRLARDCDDRRGTMSAAGWLVVDLLEAGDVAAADAELEDYERLADHLRQPYFQWWAAIVRAMRALLEGRFDEGRRRAFVAYERARRMRPVEALTAYAEQRFVLFAEEGRLSDVLPAIKANAARWPALPGFRAALAFAYAEQGQAAEAQAELAYLLRDEGAHLPRDGFLLQILAQLAHVCVASQATDHAATLYRLLLPFAGRVVVTPFGATSCGAAARPLGMLAGMLGNWDEAERHFESALTLNARLGARPWVAHSQVAYAAMLVARCSAACAGSGAACDHTERAGRLLDTALATTRELGMTRLTQRAAQVRRGITTGPEPTVRHAQLPDRLTPREVEVLRIVAAGRSNSEIAEELVLSIRTVERHIETIYSKIGARGKAARTVAAAYAHRHGLVTD